MKECSACCDILSELEQNKCGVDDCMAYENLHALISGSSSSRQYLLSLPVAVQMELHQQDAHIHTLYELRRNAEYIMRNLYNDTSREEQGL